MKILKVGNRWYVVGRRFSIGPYRRLEQAELDAAEITRCQRTAKVFLALTVFAALTGAAMLTAAAIATAN